MKYSFLLLILFLASCSLDKNSVYWTTDQLENSVKDKKSLYTVNKTTDFKSMTLEEFDLFLQDYINKSEYPNIDD